MSNRPVRKLWFLWLFSTAAIAGYLGFVMFVQEDKTLLMPGPLSDGHHQFAQACDVCHTDSFTSTAGMQTACLSCHEQDRVKPLDSHPAAKFEDPRNADLLTKVDVLHCVSCHTEHQPAMTLVDGLTQPRDVCFHCHADVATERPSHKDMSFMTCKDAGCHNFHDNRAIYTDFLIKHKDADAVKPNGVLPVKNFSETLEEYLAYPRDQYPIQKLNVSDIDAPQSVSNRKVIGDHWEDTSHARAGVNCTACHQARDEEGQLSAWKDKPGIEGCRACHAPETERFTRGKHGMRLAAGLTELKVSMARLPMRNDAGHKTLTCASCHGAHDFNVQKAAVQACLGCHADEHSLAYKHSPHYKLWQAAISGEAPANSGVSCASCHMPRVEHDVDDFLSRTMVDHNQSATLSPNTKMIRPACLDCHGLPFAIDAMADRELIRRNFNGLPTVRVDSIDLARKENERHLKKKAERDARRSKN